MKVLYVIDSLRVGGAESVLYNLTQELSQSYPDVSIEIAVLYELGPLGKALRSHGVPVISLDAPRVPGVRQIHRLQELIRRTAPDIVHTHLFPANYIMALLSLLGGCEAPIVHTEHSVHNHRRKLAFLQPVDHLIYRQFACVIGVSASVADALVAWLPGLRSRVCVIHNGIQVPSHVTMERDNDTPQLLFVANLHRTKGLDVLLRALKLLKHLDLELTVLGDGALRPRMEALAGSLGLACKVRFLGARSDVLNLMSHADCLILPSPWEGLPMVLLESMASGCPVIASSVGGIPELVEHGRTGWLVPPKDPRRLAQTLSDVLRHPEERTAVARAAFDRVRADFSIQKMAQKTIDCYHNLLNRESNVT